MNNIELSASILELLPIPTCVQQLILVILIGYGTPTANAIKERPSINDIESPIKVVAFSTLDRCRHTLYYMERTITHVYDNASYFSKEALFEMHNIYLKSRRRTPYIMMKMEDIHNNYHRLAKNRLAQLVIEESRIKNLTN